MKRSMDNNLKKKKKQRCGAALLEKNSTDYLTIHYENIFFFPVPTATETKQKEIGVTPGLIDTETVRQRGRALAGPAVLRSGLL